MAIAAALKNASLTSEQKEVLAWLEKLSVADRGRLKAALCLAPGGVGMSTLVAAHKAISIRGIQDPADDPKKCLESILTPPANRKLRDADLVAVAPKYDLEPATLAAVTKVESGGSGFLKDGRPKILFEGHIFYQQLKEFGVDAKKVAAAQPTICYPKWTKAFYKGGAGEYDRMAAALKVHEEAALASASWGLFQLMGFNAKAAGFSSPITMVAAHHYTERLHLDTILRWLDGRGLLDELRNHRWAAFAEGYNGRGYKANKYDTKLYDAYKAAKPRFA